MATLRDLGFQPSEIAPADGRAVTAPPDLWLVLVDGGKPVSAVAPGATLPEGAALPAVLVAAADMSQGSAYNSSAFREFPDASALILTDGDDVVGVIGGARLTQAILRGPVHAGSVLPGPPTIPQIVRSCRFVPSGITCATTMSFLSRPAAMPDCTNQHGLAAHKFRW